MQAFDIADKLGLWERVSRFNCVQRKGCNRADKEVETPGEITRAHL
jgi:hypothetical protein